VAPERDKQVLNKDVSDRLSDLLARLPAKQREILLLRIVLGLSAEETARVIGSTPGSVRVAQHRALLRLQQGFDAASRAEKKDRPAEGDSESPNLSDRGEATRHARFEADVDALMREANALLKGEPALMSFVLAYA
jgi:hypothetical protein